MKSWTIASVQVDVSGLRRMLAASAMFIVVTAIDQTCGPVLDPGPPIDVSKGDCNKRPKLCASACWLSF